MYILIYFFKLLTGVVCCNISVGDCSCASHIAQNVFITLSHSYFSIHCIYGALPLCLTHIPYLYWIFLYNSFHILLKWIPVTDASCLIPALSLFLSHHSRIPLAKALLSFSSFWIWRFFKFYKFCRSYCNSCCISTGNCHTYW